jgi:hypothetical protein
MGVATLPRTILSETTELKIQGSRDVDVFFKPFKPSSLQTLFIRHEIELSALKSTVAYFEKNSKESLQTLATANLGTCIYTTSLFQLEPAIKYLDATFWHKALNLTDVYNLMPQESREEWDLQIKNRTTPSFEMEPVLNTLKDLIGQREIFLARYVDNVFQSLSGEHITNQPQGFGKRMIMAPVFNDRNKEPSESCMGHINDLRNIVAILFGNSQVSLKTTKSQIEKACESTGKWVSLDGGAIKIKVFKIGTVHLEVHPDLAWRFNKLLSIIHPMALPPKVRQRPKREYAAKALVQTLISDEAVYAISQMKTPPMRRAGAGKHMRPTMRDNTLFCYESSCKDIVQKEVEEIMFFCGGIKGVSQAGFDGVRFPVDFDFKILQRELVLCGHIPEYRSHQIYPTQDREAQEAVERCGINDGDDCLEPSAGQGGIAKFMPKDTTCVEISRIQCGILEAQGFNVVNNDFLEWAKTASKVDKIVMNPPFDDGQARFHVAAAASLLRKNGRLVAILPAGMVGVNVVDGMHHEWGSVIKRAFKNTNVSVVMLTLTH